MDLGERKENLITMKIFKIKLKKVFVVVWGIFDEMKGFNGGLNFPNFLRSLN
jgi:hypothetical protein